MPSLREHGRSAAHQKATLYLAAGAAIEGFALSQHGTICLALAAVGLLAVVPVAIRWRKAWTTLAYLDATAVRDVWRLENKEIGAGPERAAEFAKIHPEEAALIREREHGFPEE